LKNEASSGSSPSVRFSSAERRIGHDESERRLVARTFEDRQISALHFRVLVRRSRRAGLICINPVALSGSYALHRAAGSQRSNQASSTMNTRNAYLDKQTQSTPPDGQPNAPGAATALKDLADQQRMVHALYAALQARSDRARLVETHISFVLLTGEYAYKIKKAVRLGFLDFTTIALRRRFCEEELRLNRRLASALYLDVVPISGSASAPVIDGAGPVLEYAVRMREFPQEALFCNVLARGELTAGHIDALAVRVADFHAATPAAPLDSCHGEPDRVLELACANFAEIESLVNNASDGAVVQALKAWTLGEYQSIREALDRRRRNGAIRECHGDLHFGNIALVDGEITIFDCIEFNESMRWIDTMSEVAFTVMDLEYRKRGDLAYRFLNAYCERSGDYVGAFVLRFYLVYRAMVRAKVACLRASQLLDSDARAALREEFAGYLRLALSYAEDKYPAVVLMHGPSGTGKTTLSQLLLERAHALRVRTDVERKRLAGLAADARSRSTPGGGLYAQDATRRTYEHVLACADAAVQGGFPAIVDGAFLQTGQRDAFRELAARRGVPFVIVDCIASEATLKTRVAARARADTDASEADLAVLAYQLRTAQPLSCDELRFTVTCDAEAPPASSPDAVRGIADRIRSPGVPPGRPGWAPPGDTAVGSRGDAGAQLPSRVATQPPLRQQCISRR